MKRDENGQALDGRRLITDPSQAKSPEVKSHHMYLMQGARACHPRRLRV